MPYQQRPPRFQTERLPVMIRAVGTFEWKKGTVLNLSQTGIQVHADAKFTTGAVVEMEFVTVNKQGKKNRRKMRATIVWARGDRYGCQFTPLSRA